MKLAGYTFLLFAIGTGLFWGMYGPALAKSRGAEGSAFKPYLMIGLAYLLWGVVGGVIGMYYRGDSFSFSGAGTLWGLIAGTLGAWGAWTLTLAMFTGGNKIPHVVMAMVFGSAVTVAAITSIITANAWKTSSPWLWVGIVGILLSAVLVAYNTPHGGPAHKKEEHKPEAVMADPQPSPAPGTAITTTTPE